jgi:lipopolysaccharide transport system permease protein
MNQFPVAPREMVESFIRNRSLIVAMIKREVIGRYRGSILGILWSFFHPLFMLAVYTFVFSFVFKARWNIGSDSKTEFALVLFSGLMVFNLFADCFSRSPNLIVSNVNFVKKILFPLEILPWVTIGTSLFHFFISLIVWLVFFILFIKIPPGTAILFPMVITPVILFALGFSWFLASLGVFLSLVFVTVQISIYSLSQPNNGGR